MMSLEESVRDKVSRMRKLTLLNTSILTAFGRYEYEPLTLEEARALIRQFQEDGRPIESAIGHQPTADLLTHVLRHQVSKSRGEFKQTLEDVALVFKLKSRPGEGKILTREELEAIGYEFGLLRKVD